jgi:hypothetical protein
MKTTYVLLVLVLTVALGAAEKSAPAEAGNAASAGERMPPQRVDLKVLKVFSAKDGAAIFRAYLVEYKGQEVVVSDTLAKTHYREGDTVAVLVMNLPFPQGREEYRLLHFSIAPSR